MVNFVYNKVAKIENTFMLKAQYRLSTKEQKVFYYLISHLNPKNEKEFETISIPLKDVEDMLLGEDGDYDAFFNDMERVCDNLIKTTFSFPTGFTINGKKVKDRYSLFSSILPRITSEGESVLIFRFSPDMMPFLLELHQYVNLGMQEIIPLKNTHAIRMYSAFKCEKDRMKAFKKEITMKYFLEELKLMLGLENKYIDQDINNFKIKVLEKIKNEINENSQSIVVEYSYIKIQRKVTGVEFTIYDKEKEAKQLALAESKSKKDIKDYLPTEKELQTLTYSKRIAYQMLVGYGVSEGISFKRIISKIKGSEFEGWEDFFIEKAIQYFETKAIQKTTPELKASTFVTWWTKNKVFDEGNIWSIILENLIKFKKMTESNCPERFEKRMLAKKMTYVQYLEKFPK